MEVAIRSLLLSVPVCNLNRLLWGTIIKRVEKGVEQPPRHIQRAAGTPSQLTTPVQGVVDHSIYPSDHAPIVNR